MTFPLFLSREPARGRRGVALITVLIITLLITAVVLGFLISSQTQQTTARFYKASSAAHLMADTVVNLVEGEINEATSQGPTFAWASQPGAIRVYDSTGVLTKIYRLYSAPKLSATSITEMNTSTTAAGSNDMPPANWAASPALWVDLNAPANDGSGNAHYPIFDAGQAANVDGFSVDTNAIAGATPTQVPMPVTWLYVLQNGEIISPDAGGSTVATFKNASNALVGPSANNPIVGRIAYWTDDDTCKVNINTAGGDGIGTAGDPTNIAKATFWDTPHYASQDDVDFANIQPVSGEFQRYPGHPGAVALNNIFNGLGWDLASSDFYNLLPRYSYGGSKGATVSVTAAAGAGAIPLKASPENRLYSSVAEMFFNFDRSKTAINTDDSVSRQKIETANFFLTAHSRAPEVTLFGQPRVSIWPVFDSTSSQARTPIDNLLAFSATNSNNPYYFTRVDPKSSTRDLGLARNQTLLSYLDFFTSQNIPGYNGSFKTKYGQSGARQILTEIFDYIRTINIADTSKPGNVAEYAQPWDPANVYNIGLYQVAPSVNNNWGTQGIGAYPRLNEVALQFVALGRGASSSLPAIPLSPLYGTGQPGAGMLTTGDTGTDPNNVAGTQNIVTVDNAVGSPTKGQLVPPGNAQTSTGATMAVQAFLLLSFINPAQTIIDDGRNDGTVIAGATVAPFIWVEVTGLNNFSLAGGTSKSYHSLGFPADDAMIDGGGLTSDALGANTADYLQFNLMMENGPTGASKRIGPGPIASPSTASPEAINPFYSKIIPITIPTDGTSGTMNFVGGTIQVKVFDGSSTKWGSSTLIQTYSVTFPGTKTVPQVFPVPTVAAINAGTALAVGVNPGVNTDRWPASDGAGFSNPNSLYIVNGDVVQSMVLSPQWSDARVLSSSKVPASAFVSHFNSTQPFSYGFYYDDGPYYTDKTQFQPGKLTNISGNSYANSTPPYMGYLPVVPPTLSSGVDTAGTKVTSKIADWDNGIAWYPDGPWINKADEGNLIPSNGSNGGQSWTPYFTQGQGATKGGPSFFSPNREVPSPGMFGSLPTGVDPTGANPTPWQTLLFRPCPGHPGENSPMDHLFMDLFWMPVAEPYAISEPFSSAGKVNLNYQIQPFTYITRSTALRAVLNPQKIAQVPAANALTYKINTYNAGGSFTPAMGSHSRVALDVNQTLTQFDDKFNGTNTSGNNSSTQPDLFHSASQICETYLVPQGSTIQDFISKWNDGSTYGLVGDNVRERPYTNIYGQITTKSNTYTIHYTVQALKNALPANLQNQWNESTGVILGEYRGSTTLERYIDPNPATALPDFAANPGSATVDGSPTSPSYYKWRVAENAQFAP